MVRVLCTRRSLKNRLTYWARNVPTSNARGSWYELPKSMADGQTTGNLSTGSGGSLRLPLPPGDARFPIVIGIIWNLRTDASMPKRL